MAEESGLTTTAEVGSANGPFTQEDPIGIAGGLNLYGYAGGDPIDYSDPFGLCKRPDDPECRTSNVSLAFTAATFAGGIDLEIGFAVENGSSGADGGFYVRAGGAFGGSPPKGPFYLNLGFERGEQPVGFESFLHDQVGELEVGVGPVDVSTLSNGGWEVGIGVGTPGYAGSQGEEAAGFRFSEFREMLNYILKMGSGRCREDDSTCR